MRPKSMKRFDQAFMAHIVIDVCGIFGGLPMAQSRAMHSHFPPGAGMDMAQIISGALRTVFVYCVMWFFVARLRLNFIRVLFGIIHAIMIAFILCFASITLNFSWPFEGMAIAHVAMIAIMLIFLFHPDSNAWFRRNGASRFDATPLAQPVNQRVRPRVAATHSRAESHSAMAKT